jgi:hypothetical protein
MQFLSISESAIAVTLAQERITVEMHVTHLPESATTILI